MAVPLSALASLLTSLLASPSPAAVAAPGSASAPGSEAAASHLGDPRDEGAEVFQGWGFDTCHTPKLSTMDAWRKSDYRAVGVYYAGHARHCKTQRHLDRDWVSTVSDRGWAILPIFVGSQSPCVKSNNKKKFRIDERYPWNQGVDEGFEAVREAEDLGFLRRSALYLDMEAYDQKDADCLDDTLAFVQGWSAEVRSQGYIPGFYSSANSGVRHLERARLDGETDLPEVIWFARWKVPASVHKEPHLGRGAWQPHRRIHQYAGDVKEKHGGVSMSIDRNRVDAPVAVVE